MDSSYVDPDNERSPIIPTCMPQNGETFSLSPKSKTDVEKFKAYKADESGWETKDTGKDYKTFDVPDLAKELIDKAGKFGFVCISGLGLKKTF